ncbi:MAG: O-methyltransferase [Bacteroidetes bacterium]|nr:O-methyltransferase [Bacteroidota bacterium]
MRDRQTEFTAELQNYVYENFNAEDELLKHIANDCWVNAGIPQINITGYQANFLQFLLKAINAKNILEIGTLAGYSSIVMARAVGDDAKILTIEKEQKHADYALKNIIAAGFENKIKIEVCNAHSFVKNYVPSEPLDFVFLDADKSAYFKYLNALTPHIRPGGLVVADNAFAFGFLLDSAPEKNPNEVRSMIGFHQHLLARNDYFTTIVPIGDGMLLSIKK